MSAPSTTQFLLPRKSIETNDFRPSTFDKSGHGHRDRVARARNRASTRALRAEVLQVVYRIAVGDWAIGNGLLAIEVVAEV